MILIPLDPGFGVTGIVATIGLMALVLLFGSEHRLLRSKGLVTAAGVALIALALLPSLWLYCEPGWLWWLWESCPPPSP